MGAQMNVKHEEEGGVVVCVFTCDSYKTPKVQLKKSISSRSDKASYRMHLYTTYTCMYVCGIGAGVGYPHLSLRNFVGGNQSQYKQILYNLRGVFRFAGVRCGLCYRVRHT